MWECPVILFNKFPLNADLLNHWSATENRQPPSAEALKNRNKNIHNIKAPRGWGHFAIPSYILALGVAIKLYLFICNCTIFLRIGKGIHKKRVGCSWRNSQFCSRCYYNSNNQSSIWIINTLGLLKFRKYNPHMSRTHSLSLVRSLSSRSMYKFVTFGTDHFSIRF